MSPIPTDLTITSEVMVRSDVDAPTHPKWVIDNVSPAWCLKRPILRSNDDKEWHRYCCLMPARYADLIFTNSRFREWRKGSQFGVAAPKDCAVIFALPK